MHEKEVRMPLAPITVRLCANGLAEMHKIEQLFSHNFCSHLLLFLSVLRWFYSPEN